MRRDCMSKERMFDFQRCFTTNLVWPEACSWAPAMPTCRRILDCLRAGDPVNDAEFDAQFPVRVRDVSATYWTPVAVARHAAKLLADNRARRVLDIGAGVGKFCIVGAAVTRGTFVGVERRASLVEAGRTAIERLGVKQASIVHGDVKNMSLDEFDGIYLFNPFMENLVPASDRFDSSIPLSVTRFRRDVAFVKSALARARRGVRVITYHGYGGDMPDGFEKICIDGATPSRRLAMWVKTTSGASIARRARSKWVA
jgi:SAM-dependent methyltransferase